MNAELFINAIGNISDRYVLEYEIEIAPQKKKTFLKFHPKWSIAACIALIVATAALVIPLVNQQTNEFLETKAHIFSSYEEFSTVVPDSNILENLSQIDGIEITWIEGDLRDTSIEDVTKAENFSRFVIEAKASEQSIATVILRLNDADGAETYIKNAALTTTAEINDVQVSYAYNTDMECWDAVVMINEDYYNILCYLPDENEFLEFLTKILEK